MLDEDRAHGRTDVSDRIGRSRLSRAPRCRPTAQIPRFGGVFQTMVCGTEPVRNQLSVHLAEIGRSIPIDGRSHVARLAQIPRRGIIEQGDVGGYAGDGRHSAPGRFAEHGDATGVQSILPPLGPYPADGRPDVLQSGGEPRFPTQPVVHGYHGATAFQTAKASQCVIRAPMTPRKTSTVDMKKDRERARSRRRAGICPASERPIPLRRGRSRKPLAPDEGKVRFGHIEGDIPASSEHPRACLGSMLATAFR